MKFEEISHENEVMYKAIVSPNCALAFCCKSDVECKINNHLFNTGHNSKNINDSAILGPYHSNLNRKNVLYVSRLTFFWRDRAFTPYPTAHLVPPA